MDEKNSSHMDGYQKALSGVAFFQHKTLGYLSVAGEDRQDFLQRQTTNDINQLTPEKPLVTVLTSPSARIIDVLTLIEEDDTLLVITLADQGDKTLTFLRSRIFFNDRVSINDESENLALIDLLGPSSIELLHRLGKKVAPKSDYLHHTQIAGSSCQVYFQRDLSMRLLIPAAGVQEVLNALTSMDAAALSR